MTPAEEVKSKLDIVEVIREYIPVRAVGANFQALCPFHNEKTPSFNISPDKQIWHCFGCGKGGDVFSFVMEKEGLSFPEALRHLATKAGVTLHFEKGEDFSKRNRILDVMALAGKYYAHILSKTPGQAAREYLLRRGLSEETIKSWNIGFSPDAWDELYKFLKARPLIGKKYTDEEIVAAGLALKKEGGRGYYDRFRARIMFPIWDANNNIVAFTARVSPEKEKTEKMGKYINSPQTQVYDKSRILFGLNKAKDAIREKGFAIVVEGQMDTISCHQHGFKNVVASSGTALTPEQVALLKRFTSEIYLLFDMDKAGQMAADRGIKEVLAAELNLKVIVLPEGTKDPDELLKADPTAFKAAVESAKPMLDYYFTKSSAGLDLEVLDNKRQVRDKMFGMISLVMSPTEQGYWLKKTAEELGFFENDVREEFAKWREKKGVLRTAGTGQRAEAPKAEALPENSREDKLAELALALLVRFPDFLNYAASSLEPELIADEAKARFYRSLIIYYNKSASLAYETLRAELAAADEGQAKLLDKLVLLGERDFYNYEPAGVKSELIGITAELRKFARARRVHELQKAISRAEKAGDDTELGRLMAALKDAMAAD